MHPIAGKAIPPIGFRSGSCFNAASAVIVGPVSPRRPAARSRRPEGFVSSDGSSRVRRPWSCGLAAREHGQDSHRSEAMPERGDAGLSQWPPRSSRGRPDRQQPPALAHLLAVQPDPGLAGRRCGSARDAQLPCWIRKMNLHRAVVRQNPVQDVRSHLTQRRPRLKARRTTGELPERRHRHRRPGLTHFSSHVPATGHLTWGMRNPKRGHATRQGKRRPQGIAFVGIGGESVRMMYLFLLCYFCNYIYTHQKTHHLS